MEMMSWNGVRTASGKVSRIWGVKPQSCMATTISKRWVDEPRMLKNLLNMAVRGVRLSHSSFRILPPTASPVVIV